MSAIRRLGPTVVVRRARLATGGVPPAAAHRPVVARPRRCAGHPRRATLPPPGVVADGAGGSASGPLCGSGGPAGPPEVMTGRWAVSCP
ncbi:hypothetical protein ACFV3F_11670, partial [Streptomyces sp. NPDC059717]|uniref:hypothetical protein n=1 Tax=Streptomyces sp. NPDC059717 TaxID=3346922 RepID=UPI003698B5EF